MTTYQRQDWDFGSKRSCAKCDEIEEGELDEEIADVIAEFEEEHSIEILHNTFSL